MQRILPVGPKHAVMAYAGTGNKMNQPKDDLRIRQMRNIVFDGLDLAAKLRGRNELVGIHLESRKLLGEELNVLNPALIAVLQLFILRGQCDCGPGRKKNH